MATPVKETLIDDAEPLVADPVGATGGEIFVRVTLSVAFPSEVTVAVELSGFVFVITTRYFLPLSPIAKVPVV